MRIKQNDTVPLQMQLKWGDGTVIDLTNALKVEVILKKYGEDVVHLKKECTVDDAINGKVKYQWLSGETNEPGMYLIEFVITWTEGIVQTIPDDEQEFLWIISDMDGV